MRPAYTSSAAYIIREFKAAIYPVSILFGEESDLYLISATGFTKAFLEVEQHRLDSFKANKKPAERPTFELKGSNRDEPIMGFIMIALFLGFLFAALKIGEWAEGRKEGAKEHEAKAAPVEPATLNPVLRQKRDFIKPERPPAPKLTPKPREARKQISPPAAKPAY
ncbi:MAG: hypothetical protein V7735_21375, partial [Photobacterium frigidiphilum]|uniref:hypothetical protein n=1 Tax=Photobacterium frigidiphilum TaxID=264736 RepID=UPI0030022A63